MTDKSLLQLINEMPDLMVTRENLVTQETMKLAMESNEYVMDAVREGMRLIDTVADQGTQKKLATWVLGTISGVEMSGVESDMEIVDIMIAVNSKAIQQMMLMAFYLGLNVSAKEDIR